MLTQHIRTSLMIRHHYRIKCRIFSRVRPFYEQAVSDLDRSMHRSLWSLKAYSKKGCTQLKKRPLILLLPSRSSTTACGASAFLTITAIRCPTGSTPSSSTSWRRRTATSTWTSVVWRKRLCTLLCQVKTVPWVNVVVCYGYKNRWVRKVGDRQRGREERGG